MINNLGESFLFLSFLMGIVGAAFSVFVLYFSYDLGGQKLQESIPFFPLIVNPQQIQRIYILLLCIGTLIGVFGAHLSVSKSLRKELR